MALSAAVLATVAPALAHPLGADESSGELALLGLQLPLSRPELVAVLLATALSSALSGRDTLRHALPLAAVAAAAGLLSPRVLFFGPSTPLLAVALASALLAVAARPIPPLLATVPFAGGAWLAGYAAMVLLGEHAANPPGSVMGGAFFTIIAALVAVDTLARVVLQRAPQAGTIALRILAAWIAAFCVMMIAFNLRA